MLSTRIIDDPITDARWAALVRRHPKASVFHTPGWLKALRDTYGYRPFVVTTSSEEGELANGIVACRMKGWISQRVVSLPFSDHCAPLVDEEDDLSAILCALSRHVGSASGGSVELRPRFIPSAAFDATARRYGLHPGSRYAYHALDLSRGSHEVFRGLHHSMKRAIHRASREGLTYESGSSGTLLERMYHLLRMTRRRHGLPPQPISWFKRLLANLPDEMRIHLASKGDLPLGCIVTFAHQQTLVYKYGASNEMYHRLGVMPSLFWKVIQDGVTRGLSELDLGRSDFDQPGLIGFKSHLGAAQAQLTYYGSTPPVAAPSLVRQLARRVVPHLPDAALDLAGRLIYKHVG